MNRPTITCLNHIACDVLGVAARQSPVDASDTIHVRGDKTQVVRHKDDCYALVQSFQQFVDVLFNPSVYACCGLIQKE